MGFPFGKMPPPRISTSAFARRHAASEGITVRERSSLNVCRLNRKPPFFFFLSSSSFPPPTSSSSSSSSSNPVEEGAPTKPRDDTTGSSTEASAARSSPPKEAMDATRAIARARARAGAEPRGARLLGAPRELQRLRGERVHCGARGVVRHGVGEDELHVPHERVPALVLAEPDVLAERPEIHRRRHNREVPRRDRLRDRLGEHAVLVLGLQLLGHVEHRARQRQRLHERGDGAGDQAVPRRGRRTPPRARARLCVPRSDAVARRVVALAPRIVPRVHRRRRGGARGGGADPAAGFGDQPDFHAGKTGHGARAGGDRPLDLFLLHLAGGHARGGLAAALQRLGHALHEQRLRDTLLVAPSDGVAPRSSTPHRRRRARRSSSPSAARRVPWGRAGRRSSGRHLRRCARGGERVRRTAARTGGGACAPARRADPPVRPPRHRTRASSGRA